MNPTYNISREAWLKERCKGIGGSDAAAVLGLSRYKSALAVYLDKIGEGEEIEMSEKMAWGLKLEKLILEEYGIRTGLPVQHNSIQAITVNSEHEWFICTLDGTATHPDKGSGVIQCKAVDKYMRHEWEDQVPEEYLIQLHHEIGVTGFKWGALAVLIGGNEFRYFGFDRDEELITLIRNREEEFWKENVLKRIPPDPTGASLDILSKMYREDSGKSITLRDDSIGKAILSFLSTKEQIERFTKEKEDAEAVIKAAMQDASQGIYMDGQRTFGISWTTVKGRTGFDSKQFEKDYPELYLKYMKTGASYRRFAVKEKVNAIEDKRRVA
jgi:putative phage-type endonuclease